VDCPGLEAAGVALLDELDWHGLASVGFIRDESGTYKLLEINPRVPASLPPDLYAGVDYPWYLWRLAVDDGSVTETPDYRVGTASHLLRGELVHLHSVLREEYALAYRPSVPGTGWNIASSLVDQPRCDCFSLEDPAPFVRDVMNTCRRMVSRA